MIAKMPMVPTSLTCTDETTNGRITRNATTSPASARRAFLIAGMFRSSAGMALISRVACHVDVAELDRRSTACVRCSSSAMSTIAAGMAMPNEIDG